MKYINFLVFIGFLSIVNLSAKTYEDAEDKKISRWETLNLSSQAIIRNVYDKSKSSQVIQLNGNGTKDAYLLMINDNKNKKLFSWQMNYSEDFVIFISLDTKLGKRYLIYTPGTKNGYMQYGLGNASIRGIWKRYSRNLEEDLQYFDNRNSIIRINSFVIRGSGSLDNIKIMKDLTHKVIKKVEEKVLKIKENSLPIKKRSLKMDNKITTNTTPTLYIEGENPFFLDIGETFDEPGVSAKDKEDGELIVTSSENIDKYKEGKYAVIYMATDREGNSVIDKRYVIVGEEVEELNSEISTESIEDSNKSSSSKNEESDTEYRLEERELEIAEWERELQFREKEISEREKNLVK